MDLLHHAGGDEGALHAEEIGSGQVVVTAHAQRENIARFDLRGQLLHLAERFIALGGDDAVVSKALFFDDADGLGFQRRGGGVGLDLNVQLNSAFAQVQHFFQRGDLRPGVFRAEPPPGIQLAHLVKGQVVDVGVPSGAAAQAGVVGHHHHAVFGHLHVQFGAFAALVDGQLEGGQGVLRRGRGVAPVRRDDGCRAAQHGAQLVACGQDDIYGRQHKSEQRCACNGRSQELPGAEAAARQCIFFRGCVCLQAGIQQRKDGALAQKDDTVREKLKEGQLHHQCSPGHGEHGLRALQPHRKDDPIQRHGHCQQPQRCADGDRKVPACQQQKNAEKPPAHKAEALPGGLPQAFALQHEQRQHQRPADPQRQKHQCPGQIERVVPGVGPDDTQNVFRHSQLGDIIRSEEKAREGNEQGTVDQDEPVLRQPCVGDIPERIAQQGKQAERLAPAGAVQPVQQDGKPVQGPERSQDRDGRDAADDGRGGEDVGSVAVVQIRHRREPQRQRPDLLHQRHEQEAGRGPVQNRCGQHGGPGPVHDAVRGLPEGTISLVCMPERCEKLFQF